MITAIEDKMVDNFNEKVPEVLENTDVEGSLVNIIKP